MELTDRERRIIAELERQFDPAPGPSGFAAVLPSRTRPARPTEARPARRRRDGPAHRAAGPAGLLGVLLLAAGLLLGVPGSVLLGGVLLGSWVAARHGRRLAAGALAFLAEAGPAAGTGAPGYRPVPWWLASGGRY